MTTKKIKTSDILGDNYYIYELTSSSYTPALNDTITITCTMKDVYSAVASSKSITLYQNGTSKGAKTTNSNGVATWSITCSSAGLQKFNIKDTSIEVFVDNKSDVGHTHSQYLTEHQSLANYVTTSDSRLSDARTPTSHTHGNLQNNGQVGSTAQANKNVVTNSSGLITTEDKPTIPSKTSQLTNDSGFLTSHQSLDSKTVTVEKLATAESGYAHTYIVKQNGTQVGSKINIPKDFLVKSASVKTVTTANNPVSGYIVGDKYLDFIINSKDNSATDEHLYVLVSDLVDTEIDWSNVQNKPLTYEPSSHTHTKSQITDFPTVPTASSTVPSADTTNGSYGSGTSYARSNHTHPKSSLYAEASHTHSQYLTSHQDISGKANINDLGAVALSNDYDDLDNKPTIPTATSELSNDSGFLTSHQDISGKENISNKVTSISSSSTDTQYPSAKCTYNQLAKKLDKYEDNFITVTNSNIWNYSDYHTKDRWSSGGLSGGSVTSTTLTSGSQGDGYFYYVFPSNVTSITMSLYCDSNNCLVSDEEGRNLITISTNSSSPTTYTATNEDGLGIYISNSNATVTYSITSITFNMNTWIDKIYPIGAIYISMVNVAPSTLFGGEWTALEGRFLIGHDGTNYWNGATGGSADAVVVSHYHSTNTSGEYFVTSEKDTANNTRVTYSSSGNRLVDGQTDTSTSSFHHRGYTNTIGVSGTGKNMPPYIGVYMWKRIG